MSLQQVIALAVLSIFLLRLLAVRQSGRIGNREFLAASFFWLACAAAVLFIKRIDAFVASMGFSAPGIDILLYLSVILAFNYLFKLRLRQEKLERDLTKITRELALLERKEKL
jgi:hypothetical protein